MVNHKAVGQGMVSIRQRFPSPLLSRWRRLALSSRYLFAALGDKKSPDQRNEVNAIQLLNSTTRNVAHRAAGGVCDHRCAHSAATPGHPNRSRVGPPYAMPQ